MRSRRFIYFILFFFLFVRLFWSVVFDFGHVAHMCCRRTCTLFRIMDLGEVTLLNSRADRYSQVALCPIINYAFGAKAQTRTRTTARKIHFCEILCIALPENVWASIRCCHSIFVLTNVQLATFFKQFFRRWPFARVVVVHHKTKIVKKPKEICIRRQSTDLNSTPIARHRFDAPTPASVDNLHRQTTIGQFLCSTSVNNSDDE